MPAMVRLPRSSVRRLVAACIGLALAVACSGSDEDGAVPSESPDAGSDAFDAPSEAVTDQGVDLGVDVPEASDASPSPCPADMVAVEDFCIDRYEAPNGAGELPLVMYTFDEASAWCGSRGKRLCFDDEWTRSCAGTSGNQYPYGNTHEPGTCNDDETWLLYDQSLLNGWPWTVSKPGIESLVELLDAARALSPSAKMAADHVEALYQAEPSGQNAGCAGADAVFDLCGNVEEWTRRRDGGDGPSFSGALKGRYWAESRTCQNAVLTHGNGFRFYEIGFRCCSDQAGG